MEQSNDYEPTDIPTTIDTPNSSSTNIPNLNVWSYRNSGLYDRDGGVVMINGSSGAGKTFLTQDLLIRQGFLENRDKVVLLSTTHKYSKKTDFQVFKVGDNSYEYSDDKFESVVNEWKSKNKSKAENGGKPKRLVIILDDILSVSETSRLKAMIRWIAVQGRHFGVLALVLVQSCAKSSICNLVVRTNINLVISSFCRRSDDRQTLCEEYILGMLPPPLKMKDAINIFNHYTKEKHSFVVFDLMSNPNSITDLMFVYKTGEEINPDMRIKDYIGSSDTDNRNSQEQPTKQPANLKDAVGRNVPMLMSRGYTKPKQALTKRRV